MKWTIAIAEARRYSSSAALFAELELWSYIVQVRLRYLVLNEAVCQNHDRAGIVHDCSTTHLYRKVVLLNWQQSFWAIELGHRLSVSKLQHIRLWMVSDSRSLITGKNLMYYIICYYIDLVFPIFMSWSIITLWHIVGNFSPTSCAPSKICTSEAPSWCTSSITLQALGRWSLREYGCTLWLGSTTSTRITWTERRCHCMDGCSLPEKVQLALGPISSIIYRVTVQHPSNRLVVFSSLGFSLTCDVANWLIGPVTVTPGSKVVRNACIIFF